MGKAQVIAGRPRTSLVIKVKRIEKTQRYNIPTQRKNKMEENGNYTSTVHFITVSFIHSNLLMISIALGLVTASGPHMSHTS